MVKMNTIQIEEYINQNTLYNQLWEIGFAVLTHQGASPLFSLINHVLDSQDVSEMFKLLQISAQMTLEEQIALTDSSDYPHIAREAVWNFEQLARKEGLIF